jgi:hypothetical protein
MITEQEVTNMTNWQKTYAQYNLLRVSFTK